MSTDPHWVTKYREMRDLQQMAEEAAKPFRELAMQIAREQDVLFDGSTVVFEEKRVRYVCRGTGIHHGDEWFEEFPVELLFERAATKMRGL